MARTLIDFNGGASVIQAYINQHAFFINLLKLAGTNAHDSPSREDMGASSPAADLSLSHLFEEIRHAIEKEWYVIHAVFPNPAVVMRNFIQRIFAQSVRPVPKQVLS